MPFVFSLLTSKWFWFSILAVLLITAGALFVRHYHTLEAQAAMVPGLQAANISLINQHARDDSRAAQAAIDIIKYEAQRDQAVADFSKWHDLKLSLDQSLEAMNRHAAGNVNPVCAPSAAERQLWNDTLSRLTAANAGAGQTGAGGQVPASPQ